MEKKLFEKVKKLFLKKELTITFDSKPNKHNFSLTMGNERYIISFELQSYQIRFENSDEDFFDQTGDYYKTFFSLLYGIQIIDKNGKNVWFTENQYYEIEKIIEEDVIYCAELEH